MSNIPTAEDFLKSQDCQKISNTAWTWVTESDLIEFAKLHVEAALKAASENIPGFGSSTDIPDWEEVEKEIKESYPLENIK